MNSRRRGLITRISGVAGASLCATAVVVSGRIHGLAAVIILSFLAGTLGHFVFTGLAALVLKIERQWPRERPGKAVYAFNTLPKEEQLSAGGKGRALAVLTQAGYPVPKGFILLPAAFDADELTAEAWAQAQTHLARLRRGSRQVSFAVRSSALNEDSAGASFAGEFESVLDVQAEAEIREAIHTVRRSRHSARVQAYGRAQDLDGSPPEMAVVIQRLVQVDFSGVLFTTDPLTGSPAQMAGNFVPGMGDKLVSGQASPGTFTFERPKGAYLGPPELQRLAPELYRNACELEKELGGPQDIEWAIAGGRLYLLQSRPITTLRGYDPATGIWNDTLKGNFLWSGTNLMEACPEVMTPFTASLRPHLEDKGGPSLSVRNYPLNGVIGGRFYANLSVQVSAFLPLFGGDAHRAYRELAGWWSDIPETLDIPLIPLTKQEWFEEVRPGLLRTNGQLGRYRKQIPAFVANNLRQCLEAQEHIHQAKTKAELAALWEDEIFPRYRDSIFYIVAASSDGQIRLERELRTLVGAETANALLSNLGGTSSRLESLGPMLGLGQVLRGELSREAYLAAYGHRGENECECAWPHPLEDSAWLDRQLAGFARAPVDIEALLARQRADYAAAWEQFCARHPKKTTAMQRRLEKVAQAARQRETVRSEATRLIGVVRTFAVRAGEMLGLGEDIFYLTIEEVLAALAGKAAAVRLIPARQEAYQRYHALPPYPAFICGHFDPLAWAADPNRRSDFFNANQPSHQAMEAGDTIRGFAGSLGVVVGSVRRLDGLEDSEQLQPGEILVTSMTNIGWTPLFPRLAAIVTDLGAPLSHAAIVARELGIPAVVGCGDATVRLKTGDQVRVDGGAGRVEILRTRYPSANFKRVRASHP
jgi:rifampicin phosphotransferase